MTSENAKGASAGQDSLLRLLQAWRLPEPDPTLAERFVVRAMSWPQERPYRPPYRLRREMSVAWLLPRVASLAAGIAIGILVGLSDSSTNEVASSLYSSLFDQSDQTSSTLVALDTSELTP